MKDEWPRAMLSGRVTRLAFSTMGLALRDKPAVAPERGEELVDDMKGGGTTPELTINISVDRLDTGIDIPRVVSGLT